MMNDSKAKRYDRQLRLWEESGQAALEASHICLVYGNALGSEILKNLVLPGVGSFTIVDNLEGNEQTLGNNFFYEEKDKGTERGKLVKDLLLELNDQVQGHFSDEDVNTLIDNQIEFFKAFSLVVVCDYLAKDKIIKLSEYLRSEKIPLILTRSYGFMGYLRIDGLEHKIIEPRPSNINYDFRLDCPFEEINSLVKDLDWDKMTDLEHSHIPYLMILLYCLNEFEAQHGTRLPKTREDKEAFKALIKSKMRKPDEENFEQALSSAHKASNQTTIPSKLTYLLNDSRAQHLSEKSDNFWILVNTLNQFIKETGNIPLNPQLPDMHSDPDTYIQLKRAYQAKANQDLERFIAISNKTLLTIGKTKDSIDLAYLKIFVKNSSLVSCIDYRSVKQEYENPKCLTQQLNDLDTLLYFYIGLLAIDKFYESYHRFPGDKVPYETDVKPLKALLSLPIPDDYLLELCRWGNSELHNVSAFIGGVASQEIIKLLTGQYVPLNNTLIFSALNSPSTISIEL